MRGGDRVHTFAKFCRWLAVLSVLVHAGLFAWHAAMSIDKTFSRSFVAWTLTQICHGAAPSSEETPVLPSQENGDECPLCKGVMGSPVIAPSVDLPVRAIDRTSCRIAIIGEAVRVRLAPVCPPSRGPPVRHVT